MASWNFCVELLLVAACATAVPTNSTPPTEVTEFACPIAGQVLQGCKTCPVTCSNPLLRCTLQCEFGCGCPSGQVIDEVNMRCVKPSQCPVDCSVLRCKAPACPDPIPADIKNGKCCPTCPPGSSCPVFGQYYQSCGSNCPPTCGNPNPICTLQCVPGCHCPPGQVIGFNSCIDVEQCPDNTCELSPEVGPCKAKFPRYFYNATSKQCQQFIYGGCEGNKNNFETLESCEKKCSECAPTCTVDFCKGNFNAKCSVPSGEPHNTSSCFGDCDETICSACYYSNETLPLPTLDKRCPTSCPIDANGKIVGLICLRNWGKWVRKANLDTYGKPSPEMKTAENYKCWRPSCSLVD